MPLMCLQGVEPVMLDLKSTHAVSTVNNQPMPVALQQKPEKLIQKVGFSLMNRYVEVQLKHRLNLSQDVAVTPDPFASAGSSSRQTPSTKNNPQLSNIGASISSTRITTTGQSVDRAAMEPQWIIPPSGRDLQLPFHFAPEDYVRVSLCITHYLSPIQLCRLFSGESSRASLN